MKRKTPSPSFEITLCPTCGSEDIHWVCEAWMYESQRGPRSVADDPHWRCDACGERLFDRVSHEVLDAQRGSSSRSGSSQA